MVELDDGVLRGAAEVVANAGLGYDLQAPARGDGSGQNGGR
jgi:hypothetical protein